jgi:hypothetical protein
MKYDKYIGHPVDVYFNLHKRVWSVRSRKTNKIILHTPQAAVKDVKFVVRESGRKRVLKEKRKNVHAFVRGILADFHNNTDGSVTHFTRVHYNPFRAGYFFTEITNPVHNASLVVMGKFEDADCWATGLT